MAEELFISDINIYYETIIIINKKCSTVTEIDQWNGMGYKVHKWTEKMIKA